MGAEWAIFRLPRLAPAQSPCPHRRLAVPVASLDPWVERDAHSGQARLKLPLPEPETVARIADVLTGLAAALRKRP